MFVNRERQESIKGHVCVAHCLSPLFIPSICALNICSRLIVNFAKGIFRVQNRDTTLLDVLASMLVVRTHSKTQQLTNYVTSKRRPKLRFVYDYHNHGERS